jgi:class 3 adenylate cyclase
VSDSRRRAAARRWWDAPAPLEALVGPEQYGRILGRSWTRLSVLGAPLATTAVLIDGDLGGADRGAIVAELIFLALVFAVFRRVTSLPQWVVLVATIVAATAIGLWVGLLGPTAAEVTVLVPIAAAMSSIWLPGRWSVIATVSAAAAYALTLLARDVDAAAQRGLLVFGLTSLLVGEMSWVLARVHTLAEQERAASSEAERLAIAEHEAREELAELNRTLEDRVEQQVSEIEGLGRLRRFVPSQVADAALTGSLQPHRRQIAVVFCDLRGFSAFSNTSEPEEILEVLEAYYEVVGEALRGFGATPGPFQGDGIVAYFNDPEPCDDPAGRAVAMAVSIQEPLDGLCLRWARRGFDLGHAMGIAYGYATLGTVGFEGRTDYTPLGAVVNMALRLRDEADWGEILIDGRTHHAVEDRVVAEPCLLDLKGFEGQVQAYRLRGAPGL